MKRPAFAVAVLLLLGCGGGGGGGGGAPAPGPPTNPTGPSSVSLDASAPTSGISVGSGDGTSGTRLEVDVIATDVSIYGIAFDLVYPSSIVSYSGSADGVFLGGDGSGTSIQVSDTGAGRLIVGATRLGNVGVITGSGVVLTLVFQATSIGSGTLSFEANEAVGGVGEDLTLSWSGGTIRVSG